MRNPLAVQLYTLRQELPGDRAGVLRRLAGFGYGAVEPYDVISDPDGLRADLDAAGLAVCSVHARPFGEQAEAALRGTRTVGADTVIVPYMPPGRFADADGVRALARELNDAAARAGGYGLRLGYHNHDFELSSLIGGRPALEVLADELDPGVLLEVDTYSRGTGSGSTRSSCPPPPPPSSSSPPAPAPPAAGCPSSGKLPASFAIAFRRSGTRPSAHRTLNTDTPHNPEIASSDFPSARSPRIRDTSFAVSLDGPFGPRTAGTSPASPSFP